MRHCIVMTVYKSPEMINYMIDAAPENFDFYVHIDRKSDVYPEDISPRAVVFKEYKIYWGSIEHLKAFLFLLSKAISSGKKYDFYHLVTGQDFFAVPFSKFDSLLKEDTPYLDCFSLPRKNWWHGGLHILKYRTLASLNDVRKPWVKFLDKLWRELQTVAHLTSPLPEWQLGGGSVYCSLPTGAVEFCLKSDIGKDMLRRLENSTCGEEVFFQTVLMNSPYKDKIVNNHLRYIDWSVPNGPKLLLEEDFDKIKSAGVLFCRKVDFCKSHELLVKLAEYITQDSAVNVKLCTYCFLFFAFFLPL